MSVVVNIENQQVVLKLSVEGSSAAKAISAANRAEQSASEAEQSAGVSVTNANAAIAAKEAAEEIAESFNPQINDLESRVEINDAKVGITPEQASAIIANSAKIGITPEQAAAIIDSANKTVSAVSVTGDANKTITLTREDGTVLTASFLDIDTEDPDDVINTLTFNLGNGTLVAVTSEGSIISVSLDGRYSLLGHTHAIADVTGLQTIITTLQNGLANTYTKAQSDSAFVKKSGDTMTGALNLTNRLRSADILPSGYIELTPINFRFDQDVLRFVNRERYPSAVISAPQLNATELDNLFSQFAQFINLNGKTSPLTVEITGLNITNTLNTAFYPFVFLHSTTADLVVKMEVMKSSAWYELYSGPVTEYHVARSTSPVGNLQGVRWTFTFPEGQNKYLRSLGCIGRNSDVYQWSVMRGGDSMYGDLDFIGPYRPKINGIEVYYPSNHSHRTDTQNDARYFQLSNKGTSTDTASPVGTTYSQAEVQAILTELRDLKTKLRTSGLLGT